MEIFELNRRAIEAKNRRLAERLCLESEDMVLEPTKTGGHTFRFEGRYFHSLYDPWKEAGLQAQEITAKKFDWVAIFGIGCGYLLKTLVKEGRKKIIIYEPALKILKGVLKEIDLSGELNLESVFICDDIDDVVAVVRAKVDGIEDIIGYHTAPYRQAFPREFDLFTNKVRNAHITNAVGISTQIDSCLKWIENYFSNIGAFLKYPPVDSLRGRFKGVPMVVAGAGPSLKKNAHLLKGLKGKAIIVAAVTAYKPLLKFGVIPDFVIAAEKVDLPEYFTYGEEDLKTRFILGEVSHPNMFDREVGGKFVYFNAYNRLSLEQAKFWGSDYFPSSGGSVTTSAFDMGLMFGCDPIIFVGQDLSFGDGRTHVPGGVYVDQNIRIDREKAEILIEEDYITPEMTEGKLKHRFALLWLKGLDGKPVASKYDWVTFHQWFEKMMANLIENGSSTRVINATEGGAYIEGMEHITLQEALERHVGKISSIEQILSLAQNERAGVDTHALTASFARMEKSLRHMHKLAKEIVKEADDIKKRHTNDGMRSDLIKNVHKIKRCEDKLFKEAEGAGFIWESLAAQTYALKEYHREKEIEDIEEQVRKDIDAVGATYKKVGDMCLKFMPELDRAIKILKNHNDFPSCREEKFLQGLAG